MEKLVIVCMLLLAAGLLANFVLILGFVMPNIQSVMETQRTIVSHGKPTFHAHCDWGNRPLYNHDVSNVLSTTCVMRISNFYNRDTVCDPSFRLGIQNFAVQRGSREVTSMNGNSSYVFVMEYKTQPEALKDCQVSLFSFWFLKWWLTEI